ncbi:hypothetical protein Tco_0589848 [Tanacetum coccineum]
MYPLPLDTAANPADILPLLQDILIRASRLKKVMTYKGKKSSMETFAPNDKADYYLEITSITFNGKNAFELKGKFLDDLHNNAFSGTNGKDAVEHIEYYLKIIDPIKLPNVDHDKLIIVVFPILLAGGARRWIQLIQDSKDGWLQSSQSIKRWIYSPKELCGITGKQVVIKLRDLMMNLLILKNTRVIRQKPPKFLRKKLTFLTMRHLSAWHLMNLITFSNYIRTYLQRILWGLKPIKITKKTGSMNGTRMYHGCMTSHGLIMEYGRNQNQSNILASLSTIKLGVRNSQPVVGEKMVIVMKEICPELTILETRSITKTLNVMMNEAMIVGKDGRSMRFTTTIMMKGNMKTKLMKKDMSYVASQYGVFQFMDMVYRSPDLVKEISTNIGGEFTNL